MAKLATLKPRAMAINTQRVKPMPKNAGRLDGAALYRMKRIAYGRDLGCCCLCRKVIDYSIAELDHRIALQFGGTNALSNLWTLCPTCHARKTQTERATGAPSEEALAIEARPIKDDDRFNIV